MKFLYIVLILVALPASAQQNKESFSLVDCKKGEMRLDSVRYYVDHKKMPKKSLTLFHMNTDGEPACCSNQIVLTFAQVGLGLFGRNCMVLRYGKHPGFRNVNLSESQLKEVSNGKYLLTLRTSISIDRVKSKKLKVNLVYDEIRGDLKIKSD